MESEKPLNRLTLRQLLTQAEKCSRDLSDFCQTHYLPKAADFRELNRPVRRRSHYPTMLAVQNSLRKLDESSNELQKLITNLRDHLQAIRDHAERERTHRK